MIIYRFTRARRFPLPDSLGQVKLPVGQMDLNRFFLFIWIISYKQFEEFQNSWSLASDDFEKRHDDVNMGSGNGLVPSGNNPLPEAIFTQIHVAI